MNDFLSNLIRPHYSALKGYVSAGMESDKRAEKIFMNANENPYELPGLEGLNRYPEPQPIDLLSSYAALYSVSPDHIVMTRGADEAIVVLSNLFCEPHQDSIIICPPTFGMYSRSAGVMPAKLHEIPLLETNDSFVLNTEEIIATAKDKDVKLIFICNPNNPTGTPFAHEDILRICKETQGHAAVILDETYAEFSNVGSLTSALTAAPNLIILRTLSKSYALAGARMGTLLCGDPDFVQLIRRKSLDAYPLPVSSIAAARIVMQPNIQRQARKNIQILLSERDRLFTHFSASDLIEHIYPSDANFLLIRMKHAQSFAEYCATHGIILRDFSDKPMTEDCIRISPSVPEHNDLLIELLMKFEKQVMAGSAT